MQALQKVCSLSLSLSFQFSFLATEAMDVTLICPLAGHSRRKVRLIPILRLSTALESKMGIFDVLGGSYSLFSRYFW